MFSHTNGVWVTELFCYLIRVCLLPFRSWSAPRARLVWLIPRGNDLRKPASHRRPQLRIAAKAPNSQMTGGYGEIPIPTRSHVFTNLLTRALSFLHQIRARLRISQAGLIHRCFGSAQYKTRREQIPRYLFQRAFVSSIARATVLLLRMG